MTIKILNNQSLLDVALQHTGSAQNAFLIAKENALSVTSYLVAGTVLMIPEGVPFNGEMLDFYESKKIQPATDETYTEGETPEELEGIGYWIINKNFKVS